MALYAFDGTWSREHSQDEVARNTNVKRFFDLPNLAASEHTVVRDFPAGTERYYVDAQGYEMVVVNGVPAMEHGKHTGALPGEVLRGA